MNRGMGLPIKEAVVCVYVFVRPRSSADSTSREHCSRAPAAPLAPFLAISATVESASSEKTMNVLRAFIFSLPSFTVMFATSVSLRFSNISIEFCAAVRGSMVC